MRILGALLPLTIVLLCSASCKPKPGESCKKDYESCETPTSRLVCAGGTYALEACKGPKGCAVENGKVACDSTHGELGDPCVNVNALVCSTDLKMELRCEGGKLAYFTRCGGVEKCTLGINGDAFCSHPFGEEGDPCKDKGACSDDGQWELGCKDGKMFKKNQCRGNEHCVSRSSGPVCDRSTAEIGDPCDQKDPELAVACAANKETILVCKGGKLTQGPRCTGEYKCGVATYGIDGRRHFKAECDQSIADVGDDCLKDLAPACSTPVEEPAKPDPIKISKSKLLCQNGKFVLDKTCKKGCEVHSVPQPFECKDK